MIILLKRRKLAIIACFFLFLSSCSVFRFASAAEVNISMTCDNTTPVSGEEFVVSVVLVPDENVNIAAYRIKINFDSTKLAYKGLYSDINNDDFKSYANGDLLTILYVTTERGFNVNAAQQKALIELNFKVLSICDVGETEISATVDGLCDYDANEFSIVGIDPLTVTVTQTGEANCDLASLTTDGYQITPAFSSDVTHYTVEVPYSKSTIEFSATPLDEAASVKASRKTLKSAGTNTDVNLTVSSPDKKSKKVYTVTVNRLTKAESGQLKTLGGIDGEEYDANISTSSLDDEDFAADSNDISPESDEEMIVNDNASKQNLSAPLIEKENGFNPVIFAIISAVFVAASIFILKRKNCQHGQD